MTPQQHASADLMDPANCRIDELVQQRLTTAHATTPGPVHLIDLIDARPARQTLCHRDSSQRCSVVRLRIDPCPECVEVALAQGVTVVRGANAAINLQRLPTPAS
jgi:hypothetical protein